MVRSDRPVGRSTSVPDHPGAHAAAWLPLPIAGRWKKGLQVPLCRESAGVRIVIIALLALPSASGGAESGLQFEAERLHLSPAEALGRSFRQRARERIVLWARGAVSVEAVRPEDSASLPEPGHEKNPRTFSQQCRI